MLSQAGGSPGTLGAVRPCTLHRGGRGAMYHAPWGPWLIQHTVNQTAGKNNRCSTAGKKTMTVSNCRQKD